ncbi:PepSY domain-containing protein [Corynebacterium aurimucosum]|uniref:PepSY-associated TM helix domain-containing protein n=1 Tax=Corynebacterium aurimucosum TaxID=169292 RepID=UPI00191F8313|nr:PepSY domain-containing protein [Corynebacterium aurimucosum]QQU95616.1 PepSY domain-containing protein [Corynebacterium aurimucosum]UTA71501.1 PepSY domain-containing protein [Corynebacterium aurimucosum]WJY69688.1 hypothetical protein CAURIM_02745 [Corynebacterium aurimucosum]
MSRTALRSFIQRIHFYGGMFVGPFILVAALTGCLYAMAPTLEKVVYHDVMSVPAVEHPVSLEEQIQAAQHEVIGDYPTYSGLGEMPLRRWISSLHESFHLGKIGELYSELAASWLWVMACGGLYMWWIRRRPKNKATANAAHQQPKRSARWKATRLHSTVGAWIFIGLLGLSATGITWSGLAGDNVDSLVERMQWKATPIETALPGTTAETHEHTMHEGHEGHGVGGASSSTNIAAEAERVFATGRAEGLTGPLRMYPPEDAHSAWQVSERWVEWRTTSDAISVDGATGDVIDRQPFSSLPLFSKLSSWGIYLHMGIMFGLPLQIALFALGLATAALVVLGYYMWWKRRPRFLPTAHFSWTTTGLGALFAATVGVFLPLLGITLAAFLILDIVLVYRATTPRRERTPIPVG